MVLIVRSRWEEVGVELSMGGQRQTGFSEKAPIRP